MNSTTVTGALAGPVDGAPAGIATVARGASSRTATRAASRSSFSQAARRSALARWPSTSRMRASASSRVCPAKRALFCSYTVSSWAGGSVAALASTSWRASSSGVTLRFAASAATRRSAISSSSACRRISYSCWRTAARRPAAFCVELGPAMIGAPFTSATTPTPEAVARREEATVGPPEAGVAVAGGAGRRTAGAGAVGESEGGGQEQGEGVRVRHPLRLKRAA